VTIRLLCGDALEQLRLLPDESVQCCITSPPYWGLRDYGIAGQLGLERTPDEYVAKLVEVFREVRRVLRGDGTLWLNLGDCYHSGDRGGYRLDSHRWEKSELQSRRKSRGGSGIASAPNRLPQDNLKDKDLVEIPSLVILALRADGWWHRARIPWLKRTGMPESTKDRPTVTVEYLFLLSKSGTYFYDSAATAKSDCGKDHPRRQVVAPPNYMPGGRPHSGIRTYDGRNGKGRLRRTVDWFFETWRGLLVDETGAPLGLVAKPDNPEGMDTATFPEALVEPCIAAGSKAGDTTLDPFAGSGTVGVVALRAGRDFIGIDLNPEYVEMARRRIEGTAPLFTELAP